MLRTEVQNSVLRKIFVTAFVGSLTFPVTNLLFESISAQLVAAVSVGAITLVVQFLIDFEKRLASVEKGQAELPDSVSRAVADGFAKVSPATELYAKLEAAGRETPTVAQIVSHAASAGYHSSPLVSAFVQNEMDRLAGLLASLRQNEATYEGEDRDWLLALTRCATRSIDAISLPMVDAGGRALPGGFWQSDLGHRYLALQEDAVTRGVRVRRIFVLDGTETAEGESFESFLAMCHSQAVLGIDVRVVFLRDVPSYLRTRVKENQVILFDEELKYQIIPTLDEDGTDPEIIYTRLVLKPRDLAELIGLYRQLWALAKPLEDLDR